MYGKAYTYDVWTRKQNRQIKTNINAGLTSLVMPYLLKTTWINTNTNHILTLIWQEQTPGIWMDDRRWNESEKSHKHKYRIKLGTSILCSKTTNCKNIAAIIKVQISFKVSSVYNNIIKLTHDWSVCHRLAQFSLVCLSVEVKCDTACLTKRGSWSDQDLLQV